MAHQPILDAIQRAQQFERPIAVYDLDSTLFNTGARSYRILEEYAAQHRDDLLPFVDQLEPEQIGWSILDELRALGYSDEAALNGLSRFWKQRFFTDDYVPHDTVYPGALDLVRRTAAAGIYTFYLTGRDVPNMRRGTLETLERDGFPLPPDDATLRMKPRFDESDLSFKSRVIDELRGMGEVLLVFENEPPNCNLFAEHFPDATVVLHTTVHAPDPPPLHPAVHRVPHLVIPAT